MSNHRRTPGLAVAAIAVLIGALSACSSSGNGSGGSSAGDTAPAASTPAATGSGAPASGSASGVVVPGVPSLATLYKGLATAPPTSGPTPKKNVTVWFLSCGQAIVPCSASATAAGQAAKALGWKYHIADGNLNMNGGYLNATRTAIAAKPDAIIDESIDCSIIEQPLKEAKAAGIPVIAMQANDCSSPIGGNGGPTLFTGPTKLMASAPSVGDYFTEWGVNGAAYIIDKTGGKAKIIDAVLDNPLGHAIDNGFRSTVKKCSNCSIEGSFNMQPTDTTAGGPFAQALSAALLKYPDANVVYLPLDSQMDNGGGAKIVQQAGRHLLLVGGQAEDPVVVSMAQSGEISAITSATSPTWIAYAAIDATNRILNKQPTVPEGTGVVLLDADHGLPKGGEPAWAPFDVATTYAKLWGVG